MFKRVVSKFFNLEFSKRVVIIGLILGLLIFSYQLFFNNAFNDLFRPDENVYSHFTQLATRVITEKNTDFLENSDVLNYYTVTENSKESTITVSLNGHALEVITLVVNNEYTLLSIDRLHDHIFSLVLFLIIYLGVNLVIGIFYSLIFNLVLIGLKYVYEHWFIKHWPRIQDFFKNMKKSKLGKYQVSRTGECTFDSEDFDFEEDIEA